MICPKGELLLDIGKYMWRIMLGIAIAGFISGIIGLGYYYYVDSEKTKTRLLQENTKLVAAVTENENTIDTLLVDINLLSEQRTEVDRKFREAQNQVNRLQELLSQHELDMLAYKKPKLIENRVNAATSDANRCVEILSGSPLTLREIDATKPSQINNTCPDIANPNYIPN